MTTACRQFIADFARFKILRIVCAVFALATACPTERGAYSLASVQFQVQISASACAIILAPPFFVAVVPRLPYSDLSVLCLALLSVYLCSLLLCRRRAMLSHRRARRIGWFVLCDHDRKWPHLLCAVFYAALYCRSDFDLTACVCPLLYLAGA